MRYQAPTGTSTIAHAKEGLTLARMCLYAAQNLRFLALTKDRSSNGSTP